jgi:hypothetical protein
VQEPTTTTATTDVPPRHRLVHAEDPARPGVALCGAWLTSEPASPAAERCVVCLDLARGPRTGR